MPLIALRVIHGVVDPTDAPNGANDNTSRLLDRLQRVSNADILDSALADVQPLAARLLKRHPHGFTWIDCGCSAKDEGTLLTAPNRFGVPYVGGDALGWYCRGLLPALLQHMLLQEMITPVPSGSDESDLSIRLRWFAIRSFAAPVVDLIAPFTSRRGGEAVETLQSLHVRTVRDFMRHVQRVVVMPSFIHVREGLSHVFWLTHRGISYVVGVLHESHTTMVLEVLHPSMDLYGQQDFPLSFLSVMHTVRMGLTLNERLFETKSPRFIQEEEKKREDEEETVENRNDDMESDERQEATPDSLCWCIRVGRQQWTDPLDLVSLLPHLLRMKSFAYPRCYKMNCNPEANRKPIRHKNEKKKAKETNTEADEEELLWKEFQAQWQAQKPGQPQPELQEEEEEEKEHGIDMNMLSALPHGLEVLDLAYRTSSVPSGITEHSRRGSSIRSITAASPLLHDGSISPSLHSRAAPHAFDSTEAFISTQNLIHDTVAHSLGESIDWRQPSRSVSCDSREGSKTSSAHLKRLDTNANTATRRRSVNPQRECASSVHSISSPGFDLDHSSRFTDPQRGTENSSAKDSTVHSAHALREIERSEAEVTRFREDANAVQLLELEVQQLEEELDTAWRDHMTAASGGRFATLWNTMAQSTLQQHESSNRAQLLAEFFAFRGELCAVLLLAREEDYANRAAQPLQAALRDTQAAYCIAQSEWEATEERQCRTLQTLRAAVQVAAAHVPKSHAYPLPHTHLSALRADVRRASLAALRCMRHTLSTELETVRVPFGRHELRAALEAALAAGCHRPLRAQTTPLVSQVKVDSILHTLDASLVGYSCSEEALCKPIPDVSLHHMQETCRAFVQLRQTMHERRRLASEVHRLSELCRTREAALHRVRQSVLKERRIVGQIRGIAAELDET